ncbi:MAG: DUF2892 domain-containing protein [Cyanobacteria bacterium HKST-UBA02]|nr:DUF2892 domain-containing protein [Cyanobacteria bacterium HKST-UBA02]
MNVNATDTPDTKSKKGAWSMDRQVRMFAGTLILIGLALGFSLNLSWVCLSAFVAIGMIVSALTDACAMAAFLSKMPWNRQG